MKIQLLAIAIIMSVKCIGQPLISQKANNNFGYIVDKNLDSTLTSGNFSKSFGLKIIVEDGRATKLEVSVGAPKEQGIRLTKAIKDTEINWQEVTGSKNGSFILPVYIVKDDENARIIYNTPTALFDDVFNFNDGSFSNKEVKLNGFTLLRPLVIKRYIGKPIE